MNHQNQHIGYIMIINGATLWGLSGPMIQWLFQHSSISSIDFLVFRLLLAGIFLLLYLSFSKNKSLKFGSTQVTDFNSYYLALLVCSVLNTFYRDNQCKQCCHGYVVSVFAPILITIYVSIQIKQLPTARQFISIVIALIGLYFLITNGSYQNILLTKQGIIFGFLTMLGFTFYTIQPVSLIKKWGVILVVG
ncbi:EamA family transporter [Staphylococcus saprophyticus]|nr:EamA family transporter [Staphylococcus saprophyticus]